MRWWPFGRRAPRLPRTGLSTGSSSPDHEGDLQHSATNAKQGNAYRLTITAVPRKVELGVPFSLRAELIAVPTATVMVNRSPDVFDFLPEGVEATFFLTADGSTILGTRAVPIVIRTSVGHSLAARFDLRPDVAGFQDFRVDLVIDDGHNPNVFMASVSGIVEVVEVVNANPIGASEHLPELCGRDADWPDYTIMIDAWAWPRRGDATLLTFQLFVAGVAYSSDVDAFRLWVEAEDLAALSQEFDEILTSGQHKSGGTAARERLLLLGRQLFLRFVPEDVQRIMSDTDDAPRTWLIIDRSRTQLPWELMVPGNGQHSGHTTFFEEMHSVGRWFPDLGVPLYGEVPLATTDLISPQRYESLKAQLEMPTSVSLIKELQIAVGTHELHETDDLLHILSTNTALHGLHEIEGNNDLRADYRTLSFQPYVKALLRLHLAARSLDGNPGAELGAVDDALDVATRLHCLTREEERILAERLAGGDLEASRQLAVAHVAFLFHILRDFVGRRFSLEQWLSVSLDKLLRLTREFNWRRGVRFMAFASTPLLKTMQLMIELSRPLGSEHTIDDLAHAARVLGVGVDEFRAAVNPIDMVKAMYDVPPLFLVSNLSSSSSLAGRRLFAKRPLIALSRWNEGPLPAEHAPDQASSPGNPPLRLPAARSSNLERARTLLAAGASAVVFPLHHTAPDIDLIFWTTFYSHLPRRVSLGEAVRLARREALAYRPDSLDAYAYILLGHPCALGYTLERSEGYAMVECLNPDSPFQTGKTYTFRVSINQHPPLLYRDRLVLAETPPTSPQVLFLSPHLLDSLPEPISMTAEEAQPFRAEIDIIMPNPGRYPLQIQLFDGEEHVKTMQTIVEVGDPRPQAGTSSGDPEENEDDNEEEEIALEFAGGVDQLRVW